MLTKITPEELRDIADLLRKASGISLDEGKGYLIETRLSRLAKEREVKTWTELGKRAARDTSLRDAIVDAMTTNETSFFRDPKTFDALTQTMIPEHYERHGAGAPLRIWSAACSTGQEPYTLAIVLREMFGSLAGRRIQIVGTDISPTALAQASKGIYSELEVSRGLSKERIQRHFSPVQTKSYQIRDELRGLATYHQLNLLAPGAGARLGGAFDMVFCRNVAIYFEEEDRGRLFENVAQALKPQGVLILGLTERVRGTTRRLERQVVGGIPVYRRVR